MLVFYCQTSPMVVCLNYITWLNATMLLVGILIFRKTDWWIKNKQVIWLAHMLNDQHTIWCYACITLLAHSIMYWFSFNKSQYSTQLFLYLETGISILGKHIFILKLYLAKIYTYNFISAKRCPKTDHTSIYKI